MQISANLFEAFSIVVRPVAGGRYQVIAGERRCEAARMLHHQTIPAVVRPVSNEQAMEMTIVENLQRLDLTPMEEARGYDRLSREFGLTQEQMALRTGKERSSVANFLRLLRLPPSVQAMLDQGELSFGHAKVLMALESPKAIEKLARRVLALSLSVRQTEQAVTNLVHPGKGRKGPNRGPKRQRSRAGAATGAGRPGRHYRPQWQRQDPDRVLLPGGFRPH